MSSPSAALWRASTLASLRAINGLLAMIGLTDDKSFGLNFSRHHHLLASSLERGSRWSRTPRQILAASSRQSAGNSSPSSAYGQGQSHLVNGASQLL